MTTHDYNSSVLSAIAVYCGELFGKEAREFVAKEFLPLLTTAREFLPLLTVVEFLPLLTVVEQARQRDAREFLSLLTVA